MTATTYEGNLPAARQRYLVWAIVASVSLLGITGALGLAGARVNTSRSIALGLYWTSARPVQTGEYVLFCPPHAHVFDEARRRGYLAAGFCPGHYGYMMKRIVASGGNVVTAGAGGVRVNGRLLPFSVPLSADRAGRPMPVWQTDRYVLGPSELLLMSDVSRTSFDARYFGPVDRTQVKSVIVPVLTW